MKSRITFSIVLAAALLMAGCSFFAPDEFVLEPPAVDSGDADFSVYVAIGNSLTAGYQSGALYHSTQQYSMSSLLADVMVVDSFEVPWIADPGIYDSELGLGHLTVVFDDEGNAGLVPIPWPENVTDPLQLMENGALPAPYHNLGVPGATTYDLLMATDADDCFTAQIGNPNDYFNIILRNSAFDWSHENIGGPAPDLTVVEQAILVDPSFVSVWIGNNELLMPAMQGLGHPFYPATAAPEDPSFESFYTGVLGGLVAALPDAKFVTANLPNVTEAPYFTTVPWFLVDPEGNPIDGDPGTEGIQFVGYLSEDVGQMVAGDYVLLGLLSHDSDENGTPDVEEGLGFPRAILVGSLIAQGYTPTEAEDLVDTVFPFNDIPLPASLTLEAAEAATMLEATEEYNAVIATVAGGLGIPVVNINSFFSDLASDGYDWNGEHYTTTFVTGGLFSLDGVHPSNIGSALIAGEFIKVINDTYGSNLGVPSLPEFPATTGESPRPVKLPESFPNMPF